MLASGGDPCRRGTRAKGHAVGSALHGRVRVEQLACSELVSIKLRLDGAKHAAVDFSLAMKG